MISFDRRFWLNDTYDHVKKFESGPQIHCPCCWTVSVVFVVSLHDYTVQNRWVQLIALRWHCNKYYLYRTSEVYPETTRIIFFKKPLIKKNQICNTHYKYKNQICKSTKFTIQITIIKTIFILSSHILDLYPVISKTNHRKSNKFTVNIAYGTVDL